MTNRSHNLCEQRGDEKEGEGGKKRGPIRKIAHAARRGESEKNRESQKKREKHSPPSCSTEWQGCGKKREFQVNVTRMNRRKVWNCDSLQRSAEIGKEDKAAGEKKGRGN